MKYLFLILLQSFTSFANAQKSNSVSINVNSKFYVGKQVIIQGGKFSSSNGYNDFDFIDTFLLIGKSAKVFPITSERSKIKVNLKYPHPFQISYIDTVKQTGAGSFYFFIYKKEIYLRVNDLNVDNNVIVGRLSPENKEYLKIQNLYKKFVNLKTFEIYDLPAKQKVMQSYILKNPNSYVALWDLIIHYNPSIKEEDKREVFKIVQKFSSKIQATNTYQNFIEDLSEDLKLVKGVIFPKLLMDSSEKFTEVFSKNTYTLIDFWFSSCEPCIAQFGELGKIYDDYRQKGFEIIGVSTDSRSLEAKWRGVISKFNLEWIQYLDAGGTEAERLFIRKYPTNFLVDRNGKIVEVDIEPLQLERFLKQNIEN